MKAREAFTIGQILVFGAVLPTVDTFADLILSGKLFVDGHNLWAIAILLPVLINFFFIVIAFRQFPFPPWHHRYISLVILVLQVETIKKAIFCFAFPHKIARKTDHLSSPGLASISLPWHCVRVPHGPT